MSTYLLPTAMGYLLGCLSPSAFFSMVKKKDVSKQGTGNLGATNTMLVLGKKYGVLVMILDIFKSYFAVRLARRLFPALSVAGLVAGAAAVIGHIFPFYLNFRGGKGLATLGGLILGLDPILFPILLTAGLAAMFVINVGYAMPVTAAALFPILYGLHRRSVPEFLIAAFVGGLIVYQNVKSIKSITTAGKTDVRAYLRKMIKR